LSLKLYFFSLFFDVFFDGAISPSIEYGIIWPPKGIISISFYSVPLLNTLILLRRGVSITWAHFSILSNNFTNFILRIIFTVLLGVYFLYFQLEEYFLSTFTIIDGIYGRIFYISTGFHGIHVFVGIIILRFSLYLGIKGQITFNHHFIFEARAWYWHFVDIVWLFLYLNIYIWCA